MKRLSVAVNGYGKFIGTKGKRVVIRDGRSVLYQNIPSHINHLVISGGGGISFQAIRALADASASLVFIDGRGGLVARLQGPVAGNALVRREQYQAALDARGVYLAKQFVLAKLSNQRALLGSYARQREGSITAKMEGYVNDIQRSSEDLRRPVGASLAKARRHIMGIEGRASRAYWQAVKAIIPHEYGFEVRSGRGATDLVNAMLNYGYAILVGEVWRAVDLTPLDPYAGFLHADRAGRPALVLDLMEQFRQQLVDRVVIGLVIRRRVRARQETTSGPLLLDARSRNLIIKSLFSRLQIPFSYCGPKKSCLTDLVEGCAERLTDFLTKRTVEYRGFWLRW
jgi:CRISPR-associated protein Cas1